MKHRQDWFLNRSGKIIYRVLKDGSRKAIKIRDKKHGSYIHLCQQEMGLRYSDK